MDKTISCTARGLGKNVTTAGMETFSSLYEMFTHIRIKTAERIDLSSKITNIRSGDDIMWMEDDGDPTVFDVVGLIPVTEVFGTLVGYEVLCNRSSAQRI
jgi:hypothetical protein